MKQLLIIILAVISVTFFSCRKNVNPPVFEDYYITRSVSFYLKDSLKGENLIGISGEKYNADTIRIFDDNRNGRTVEDESGMYYSGIMYFFQLANKEDDINTFYIDWPVYVYLNQFDMDTLRIKKEVNQQFKFYYNNKLIDSIPASEKEIPRLTIKK